MRVGEYATSSGHVHPQLTQSPRQLTTHDLVLMLTPLTEEQREIQSTSPAQFADGGDRAARRAVGSARRTSIAAIAAKLGELGFLGMLIPEEYDGLGLDTLTYLMALEEIAAADASTAVLMSVHNSLPTQMLLNYGTDAQRERYLRPMARGEMIGAFALSEPEAGSDASSLHLQRRARRRRLGAQRARRAG